MSPGDLDMKWNAVARALLVGRRIVEVGYMTREEADGLGWSRRPVVLTLDDGTTIYPSSDDEGNDGGSLFTSDKGNPVLPVL